MSQKQPSLAIFLRNLVGGGAERVMLNIAKGIAQQGIAVDIVLIKKEGEFLEHVPPQIRIVNLNTSRLDKGKKFKLPTSFQSTTSLPKLVRYLRQERPKTLVSAAHFTNEIAILAKYLARVSTRVIVSEHTTLSQEAQRVEQLSARVAPLMAKTLYPWANEIVAVSNGVAQDLAQITGIKKERIQVIYNPVIAPELIDKAEEPLEHSWFAEGEPPVILGIGRFVTQKDFATLIRAFAKVRQRQPVRLMMLGNGRDKQKLQTLAAELGINRDIAWIGFVDNPFAYMKRASLFVLSSAWEGLPTVLIEAMAVALPVVSTNCPSGPAEILDNGKYGELVPVGDTQAMAEAIIKVLAGNFTPVERTWLDRFTLKTATQQYLALTGIPNF